MDSSSMRKIDEGFFLKQEKFHGRLFSNHSLEMETG